MTNKMKLIWLTLITLSLPLLFTAANSTAQESLATDELIQEENWQLVRDNCTECHSSLIIVQNSGNRASLEESHRMDAELTRTGRTRPRARRLNTRLPNFKLWPKNRFT